MTKLPLALQSLLRTTPTIVHIPNRSLLSITGSQATQWLNGLLSSTVPDPPRGHFYSAFLHAQGRVLHDVFVYAQPNAQGYFIEYDSCTPSADFLPLIKFLKQFVLRAKVKIRDVSDEYGVWAAWGSERESHWETKRHWRWAERSNIAEPQWDLDSTNGSSPWGSGDLVLQDRRGVGMGHRLLVKRGEQPQEAATHDVASPHDYTIHRFLNGIPEGISELQWMQSFPIESNLDLMGAIDFRKGCYVGQELTVRTYHTGVIRKRIFPVAIHSTKQTLGEVTELERDLPIPDSTIRLVTNKTSSDAPFRKPRGNSKLLSSVGGVGLALLRCDHVSAVDAGSVQLVIGDGEQERRITHWYPHWWPVPHERILQSPFTDPNV